MSDEISLLDQSQTPLYLGKTMYEPGVEGLYDTTAYNTGGPGYILNKASLLLMRYNLHLDHCSPFVFSSAEDVFVAECLQRSNPSVTPFNTRDDLNRPRFHHYPAGFIYLYNQHGFEDYEGHWYRKYDPDVPSGNDCCSNKSISFHFMDHRWALKTTDFLFHCPRETINEYFAEKGYNYFSYKTVVTEIVDKNEEGHQAHL